MQKIRQKKKYSPHLSIKRLRELAEDYVKVLGGTKQQKDSYYFGLIQFINFTERERPSLKATKKITPLPVREKKI